MFRSKSGSPAHDSGMRPGEDAAAYGKTPGEEAAIPPQEDAATRIEDFTHGPDEHGDHHLNISKLHRHLHKGK